MSDLVSVLLLVLFAWLGERVYHDVNALSQLGVGIGDAGRSIRAGFSAAASAVSSIPLAGGALGGSLRGAAGSWGGGLTTIGQSAQRATHHLAIVLGLLMWATPSSILLVAVLPGRVREFRARHRTSLLLNGGSQQSKRLLAVRAVLTLPDEALFAHTPDPGGDLLAGRYDALVAAGMEGGNWPVG